MLNIDFIEWKSMLEKSYQMRDVFLHSKHGMVSPLMHRQAKTYKLISWNVPVGGWQKVNTDGVACIQTGNAKT